MLFVLLRLARLIPWLVIHVVCTPNTLDRSLENGLRWLLVQPFFLSRRHVLIRRLAFVDESEDNPIWVLFFPMVLQQDFFLYSSLAIFTAGMFVALCTKLL